MKNKWFLIGSFIILIISIIACGSSNVVVNTPTGIKPVSPPNSQVATQPASAAPTQPASVPQPSATVPLGSARSNPAPVGSEIHADDMVFTVTGMVRPADTEVKNGNMFNSEAPSGKEYMFVTLSIKCELSTDKQCNYSSFNLKALGGDGILNDAEFMVTGVDGLLEDTTFYGGASISGNVPFLVNKGDTAILLVYQPFLGESFYLALPVK